MTNRQLIETYENMIMEVANKAQSRVSLALAQLADVEDIIKSKQVVSGVNILKKIGKIRNDLVSLRDKDLKDIGPK